MEADRSDAASGFTAVVLAGGTSSRFGSDKLAVRVAGSTLLERVLAAVASATQVVVVGERRPVQVAVTWTREDPPGSGPAAAVVAALPLVRTDRVVLLAADQPFVDETTVARLLRAARPGAVLVDGTGRRQYLCSAFVTADLRAAAGSADWTDRSVRALLSAIELVPVRAEGREAHDVDTPDDVPSGP